MLIGATIVSAPPKLMTRHAGFYFLLSTPWCVLLTIAAPAAAAQSRPNLPAISTPTQGADATDAISGDSSWITVPCISPVASTTPIIEFPCANLASGLPAATPQQNSAPTVSLSAQSAASGSLQVQGQSQPNSQAGSSNPPAAQESQHQRAAEQLKEEEKQRVVGIVPTFNVTYRQDAVPLSPGQKMDLALHSTLDIFTFASAFAEAGYYEVDDDLVGFSWGAKGYFERTGAAYLDTADGTILSTGVVPILFRQDPRYFRLGYGPKWHRTWYALASSFIAKGNRSGKWEPNYGNLLGNLAAGGVSNLYYPPGNTSVGLTMTNFAIQIAEGMAGAVFEEFWPDISRKLLHRDPTHGLDAGREAEYETNEGLKQDPQQFQSH